MPGLKLSGTFFVLKCSKCSKCIVVTIFKQVQPCLYNNALKEPLIWVWGSRSTLPYQDEIKVEKVMTPTEWTGKMIKKLPYWNAEYRWLKILHFDSSQNFFFQFKIFFSWIIIFFFSVEASRPRFFFEIQVNGDSIGRIVIQVYRKDLNGEGPKLTTES